jgi:hypothetical protein
MHELSARAVIVVGTGLEQYGSARHVRLTALHAWRWDPATFGVWLAWTVLVSLPLMLLTRRHVRWTLLDYSALSVPFVLRQALTIFSKKGEWNTLVETAVASALLSAFMGYRATKGGAIRGRGDVIMLAGITGVILVLWLVWGNVYEN